jgi:hypothetical protein
VQFFPSARDTTFDRSDSASADRRDLLIGESVRDDENQRLATHRRQFLYGGVEIPHGQRLFLTGRLKHHPIDFLKRLESEAPLAETGDVEVAKYGEYPSLEVTSGLELLHRSDRANHGILHQIIGAIIFAAQHAGKRSQVRQDCNQAGAELMTLVDFVLLRKHRAFSPPGPSLIQTLVLPGRAADLL